MAKQHVLLYYSYLDDLASFSDVEFGRLTRAMLLYARDGVETPLKRKEQIIWPVLRANIDRANAHYDEVSRRRKEAAEARRQIWEREREERLSLGL